MIKILAIGILLSGLPINFQQWRIAYALFNEWASLFMKGFDANDYSLCDCEHCSQGSVEGESIYTRRKEMYSRILHQNRRATETQLLVAVRDSCITIAALYLFILNY